MPKKILYIWKGKYPWDVRIEKICKTLHKNNFEVFILARWIDEELEFEDMGYAKVIRVGYQKSSKYSIPLSVNPFWKKAIIKAVKELKPDLLIPREIMLAEAAGKIGEKYNIPVIMDMAEHYPAAMRGWKKYNTTFPRRLVVNKLKIPDMVERNSLKLMSGIITVCQEQNNRLNSFYNFPNDKLGIVHNTPILDINCKTNTLPVSQAKIFSHHGYLTAEKSIINFLKGFIKAAQQIKDIKFLIAGDGECFEDINSIVNNSNIKDRIILSGKYEYNQLNNILGEIDIGVIPYQVSDFNNYTIHNKIFDYFALGKPVITSFAKPLKRIVEETNAGLAIDCSNIDNIADFIIKSQEIDWTEHSKNALKFTKEKYNWEVDSVSLLYFINKFII